MRRTFHLIPHTHWDREWYLTRAAFEARLVPMVDELMVMLERHRGMRFTLDGQTILLEDYLAVKPAARPRIARLVRRGQLAIGPWYVLADELIPNGISLAKNLETGMADARALGGVMKVLYSPDAFGHPHFLPTLAARFGLRWGVVWRGLAGHRVKGPDVYRWVGPDGARLLVHHLPPDGYEVGAHLPGIANRSLLGTAWATLREQLVNRSRTKHVALPVGADHHAPHPDLPTLVDRLRELDPGHEFRWSRWEDYFAGIERSRVTIRTLRGELRDSRGYTWTLQGVHGTRARMKRRHSRAEAALALDVEPLVERLGRRGNDLRPLVDVAWRRLLQSQFHDTIAGTVADPVAAEQTVRLASVRATSDELTRTGLAAMGGGAAGKPHAARLVVWKRDAIAHDGVVLARIPFFRRDVLVGPPGDRVPRVGDGLPNFGLRARSGRKIPVQVVAVRQSLERRDSRYTYPDLDLVDEATIAFEPGRLAQGVTVFDIVPDLTTPLAPRTPVIARGHSLGNGRIRLTVDRDGRVRMVDERSAVSYDDVFAIEDERDRGDLYTPWLDAKGPAIRAQLVDMEVAATGPLVGRLVARWQLQSAGSGTVSGKTELSLTSGSASVRCRIVIDNDARNHRLVIRFPVGTSGPILAGAGIGAIRRSDKSPAPSPAEWAVPTAPAHRFVAIGDRNRGLIVQHTGFFEYECDERGSVAITLVRGVGQLSRNRLPSRPGHAGWPTRTPGGQERGRHVIELGVSPMSARSLGRQGSAVGLLDPVLTMAFR